MIALKNVLVPVDFSEPSELALKYARHLARTFGARLQVLHVMENQFLRPMANDPHVVEASIARRLEERISEEDRRTLHVVAVTRRSDAPADEIVKYATDHDINLIVMGTHGRVNVAHMLMGSVAEKVVRTAPCPVLTVRQGEREFVVADGPPASAAS